MSRGHEGSNETADTCIEIQRIEDVQHQGLIECLGHVEGHGPLGGEAGIVCLPY